jgi:hypothetical protein
MDDKKKKRLAALKAEIQCGAKPPVKQKEKLDLWDELNLNKPVIADRARTAVPPTPIEAAPIPNKLAVIAAVISPKPEPVKQTPIAPPAERTKIYRWPDGYYLANGKLIDPEGPGERFKIFHPPNQWLARTEDGTAREYEITVELDAWDSAQLQRVNRVLSHNQKPSVVNPYTGFRE